MISHTCSSRDKFSTKTKRQTVPFNSLAIPSAFVKVHQQPDHPHACLPLVVLPKSLNRNYTTRGVIWYNQVALAAL